MKYPLPRRLRPSSERWYRAWDGLPGPDPPRKLRCYLRGCDVPPAHFQVTRQVSETERYGRVYEIRCQRCGRSIRPYDNDYPRVE